MKQGRTPDRVHVVRPQDDDERTNFSATPSLPANAAPQNGRAMEIIRTLAQISDKLKRSEAERYELMAELREYRKSLNELEDKAEKSDKAYMALESKLKSRDTEENELLLRQAKLERALKETENKLVQASAGQNLLDQRIKNTEEFQSAITARMDESITQQARIDRQVEKISQDKSRMLRKVERMEEILTETQDTLKARALVLLTDQSTSAHNLLQIPALGENPQNAAEQNLPWWRKTVRMQSVGMASMVIAALLFGWTINQIQQPEIPRIAVLENGGVAKLDMQSKKWEMVNPNDEGLEKNNISSDSVQTSQTLTPVQPIPVENNVLESSDEDLMKALEENPDAVAAQLNAIEPGVGQALEIAPAQDTQPIKTGALYNPLEKLGEKAFVQDLQISNIIKKEVADKPLGERIQKDETLPAQMKDLEQQAFAGVPEAQHDLAAIYTSGRGVVQNFEKSAFWFRESADSNIPNAAYNLGVLYHQGLGVEKDLDRALYWYRVAAKQGHPEAQYNLGIAHIEGIGTSYNAPLAAAFFESAANQGVVEAAYNLGLIYENALIDNTPKPEQALLWFKIAADGGNNDAKAALLQLASTLKIESKDVDKMVNRLQANYESLHGRKAGGVKS